MKKLAFTNDRMYDIFDEDKFSDLKALMFDTAMGKAAVEKEEANDKIREVMFEVLGIDENSTRKEIKRAIRRHQVDVFEVIEETVENLLTSGWGEDPFFNQFVEIRNLADGDRNSFYTPDDIVLTVGKISGNHHDIMRQRLGAGKEYSVPTSWYGVKVYTEFELFMMGRVDWAMFVQKIYEAFDKKVNDMVYTSLTTLGDAFPAARKAQFIKTGALTEEKILTLAEDVQVANNRAQVVIMGTKAALNKLSAIQKADWISNDMKVQRNTTGKIGMWEGYELVEIPQVFEAGTTTRALSDTTLYIMPVVENKFIKLVNEGEPIIKEVTSSDTNMDMTMEYEYQTKLGIGVQINRMFGTYTITA